MAGEIAHLLRDVELRDVLEIGLFAPHLVGVAQHRRHDALAERLEQHHPLAAGDHDARDPGLALLLHGVADDRERLLRDLVVGAM
jgi:hypothetical protein